MESTRVNTVFKSRKAKCIKLILVGINVVLVFVAVVFSWKYSKMLREEQQESALTAFCAAIESMKQVSDNYLTMELGYAQDWAKYIDSNDMTIEEALDYINQTNHQTDRYAHIVDLDTMEAYSTYKGSKTSEVFYYQKLLEEKTDTDKIFIENMQKMLLQDNRFNVLGKYRTDDTQLNVISVGTGVTLVSETGEKKEYLLLRVIPLESIRKIWVFPVEYMFAEVGIITKSGSYVVPSKSMRSLSFAEFLWGYNFEEDYGSLEALMEQLATTDSGLLEYKDSKGEECYWYYSSFGEDSGMDILGYIPVSQLDTHKNNWAIVGMTCGVLFLLIVLDGAYVLHINRKLRETVQLAESASHAKTNFLSTMSHDIRTPLNGIIGMTNLAKSHIGQQDYVENCLNKVSLASNQLLTLVNDILDFSKVESGNMVLNPIPFSLQDSIEKLVDIVQTQIEDKELTFTVEKELPFPYLIADELRLNQIFMNILTNAVKYTPQGGSISMTVTEEELPQNKVRLLYRVADTGIGMSQEFQKDMYQMFARELDSRIDKTQGTGLGLAIVKQMADLMGGTIACDSVVNEGTTFTVTVELPIAEEKQYRQLLSAAQEDADRNDFEGIHVLVAEDNDLNWEIICELLRNFHVTCDRAENGRECLKMLQDSSDNTYQLVLMDIQMPVMDGKKAAKLIRRNQREYVKNIMIVAMTADAFAEDVQACLRAGMNGHIAKPVDVKKVVEVLRQVQQKQKQ